jgi:hypothetical protein
VSLKENISMVKEELNAEEQFFEQAVKTERFIKKYKKPLIGVVGAIVLGVVVTMALDAYTASKRDAANAAYMTLQNDPLDAQAQQTLKADAPLLYDAWKMSQAIQNADTAALQALSKSAAPEVADVSAYEAAALAKAPASLGGYASRLDSIYRDMAIVDEAVLLIHAGKSKEARQRLRMIDAESPLAPLAEALSHYGIQ